MLHEDWSIIDDARNVRDYIFTKAILLAKFVKISSLKNYCLYGNTNGKYCIKEMRSSRTCLTGYSGFIIYENSWDQMFAHNNM